MTRQQKLAAALLLSVLAILASLRPSGGTVAGFAVVLILNPIVWAACYFFFKWSKHSSIQNAPITEDSPSGHPRRGNSYVEVIPPKKVRNVVESKPEDEMPRPKFPADVVVMRVDGSSSFLTVAEHIRRGGRELAECDLSTMTFERVSFCEANLNGVKIHSSSFRHCNFKGASLKGAQLDGSSFVGCDFRDADLTDTSAQNCDFQSAQFDSSDIRNVDLSTSNLVNADLHKVKYDSRTIFPDGYPIPSDAVDMGAELPAKQSAELKAALAERFVFEERKREQTGALGVYFTVLIVLSLAAIGFYIWSIQQPDNNGTPLLEIVSEPDLRSASESRRYLEKLGATIKVNEQGEIDYVSLFGTQITDAGLVHLERLPGLEWLGLSNTQITDAGLVHLEGLTSLQSLGLIDTQITDAGVTKLKEALPSCQIDH